MKKACVLAARGGGRVLRREVGLGSGAGRTVTALAAYHLLGYLVGLEFGAAAVTIPIVPHIIELAVPLDRPFRLGVLSDTHRYSRPAAVPHSAIVRMGLCDAYLHCGDFLDPDMLRPLQERASMFAVLGNVDPAELGSETPIAVLLRIGTWRIGAVHDAGRYSAAWERTASRFPERLDVLCFGHSHRPVAENVAGMVFLNPGSAVDPRGLPAASVATLELSGALDVHLLKLPVPDSPLS